ncbi:hypothetical protein [Halosegnis marinus]|uniref:Uncharacterized protein n=1 Tax=Halosegnis marinus TaxID=3034023 RepID=A0ABD5ZQN8_9EURY|nr:hypothetical protein [Halosegnis sp. DT85]
MDPNNPHGRATGRQPTQGSFTQAPEQQAAGTGEPMPVAEMSVSTPTLRRVSMNYPNEQLPLGENDYVLESVYNPQLDAWEALVLVRPEDDEGSDE